MDKMSLAMLRIFSDEPAVLVIDGSAAGRTGKDGFALPVAGRRFIIQLFALTAGFAPITKYISLEPPGVTAADETLRLFCLPGGVFELRARFGAGKTPEKLPYVLASLGFASEQKNLKASVYFDRAFGLAVEEGEKVIFSHAFSHSLVSAKITLRPLYGAHFLIAEGMFDGGVEVKIIRPRGNIALLLERNAAFFSAEEQQTEIVSFYGGTKLRELFMPAGEKTFERPSAVHAADAGAVNLFHALVYAVKNEMEEFAVSLLDASLKNDVGFTELRDFFGDFEDVFQCAEGTALTYSEENGAARVRIFGCSVKNEKIANITEY